MVCWEALPSAFLLEAMRRHSRLRSRTQGIFTESLACVYTTVQSRDQCGAWRMEGTFKKGGSECSSLFDIGPF